MYFSFSCAQNNTPSYNPLFLLPCYMQLLSPFPPPQSLKGSLLHTLASLPPDLFSASTRVEWLPLLHSSALLFPLLRTRREMHTISWRYCPPLPHTLLTVSTYTPTCLLHEFYCTKCLCVRHHFPMSFQEILSLFGNCPTPPHSSCMINDSPDPGFPPLSEDGGPGSE